MFEVKRIEEYKNPTIIDLFQIKDSLDFSPIYQRYGEVWNLDKKRLLIDTIINGYDIPKFYFHYLIVDGKSINDSGKKFAIVDGKQRLIAIFEFLKGDFTLDESVKFLRNTDLDFIGKKYSHISEDPKYFQVKLTIDSYVLDVMHIITDEADRIEEMFLRLNEGVPVNNAEKRNSIGGYLIEEINNQVKRHVFFKEYVKFSNKRMEREDLMAKLCLIEDSPDLESFTKTKLDQLVKKYKPKKNSSESEKSHLKHEAKLTITKVVSYIDKLTSVFNKQDDLLKSRGIIPLYYLFVKKHSNLSKLKSFLRLFEQKRAETRRILDIATANKTLLQFDRLNQQGAYQSKSLMIRLKIVEHYYDKFLHGDSSFKEEIDPKLIGLAKEDTEKREAV